MHPGEERPPALRPVPSPAPNGRGASPGNPAVASRQGEARRGHGAQEAADYWRGYSVTVHWDRPMKVIGTVLRLSEVRYRDDWVPKVHLLTDRGTEVIVVPFQARLLAELVRLAPAVGDRVTIDYRGEASTSAPGMRPAKEFVVTVTRPGGPPGKGA